MMRYDYGSMFASQLLCTLPLTILYLAAYWRIYTKAGRPGWASIIPIYNLIVLLDIAGKPWWWLLLMFIPLVNFVVLLVVMFDLARAFGQDTVFGCGLIFLAPIFILLLAFSSIEYVGLYTDKLKRKNDDLFFSDDEKPKRSY